MRARREIGIPDFMERWPASAYNPAGFAARAAFLRDVAVAWRKAGDQDTAAKMQRDADNQALRSIPGDAS